MSNLGWSFLYTCLCVFVSACEEKMCFFQDYTIVSKTVRKTSEHLVSVNQIRRLLKPILNGLSGWPVPTLNNYCVTLHLIWMHLYPVLDGLSGRPVLTHSGYSVSLHLIWHHLQPILDRLSGWPLPTHSEYLTTVHLIQPHLYPILDRLSAKPVQSWTTEAHHIYCGQTALGNCPVFVESSSALQKESIAHFLTFLASCLGEWPNFWG